MDDAFELGVVMHAALFMRPLLNILNCIQIKFNSKVTKAIRKILNSSFEYPKKPETNYKSDGEINTIKIKPDEMKIFMWRKI